VIHFASMPRQGIRVGDGGVRGGTEKPWWSKTVSGRPSVASASGVHTERKQHVGSGWFPTVLGWVRLSFSNYSKYFPNYQTNSNMQIMKKVLSEFQKFLNLV
jgi:hypothetical protein